MRLVFASVAQYIRSSSGLIKPGGFQRIQLANSSFMSSKISRTEVMDHLDRGMDIAMSQFLKPVEDIWQPTDLLPEAGRDTFFEQVRSLQAKAENLSYDLLV